MASAATYIEWNRKSNCAMGEATLTPNSPLDDLAAFGTAAQSGPNAPARYAIRQVLDQEYQTYLLRQNADARQARYRAGAGLGTEADVGNHEAEEKRAETMPKAKPIAAKRDFFGRVVEDVRPSSKDGSQMELHAPVIDQKSEDRKVWVSFHEGFSNAVRKPITLDELMRGF